MRFKRAQNSCFPALSPLSCSSFRLPIRVAVSVAVPVATLDPQAGIAGALKHPRAYPGQHSCMQCLCKFIYAKETQSSPGFGCNLLTTRVTAPERQCCLALAYVQRAVHTDEVVSPPLSSPPLLSPLFLSLFTGWAYFIMLELSFSHTAWLSVKIASISQFRRE